MAFVEGNEGRHSFSLPVIDSMWSSITGVERGKPGGAGLWEQGVDTETCQTPQTAAVGSERAGPEESQVPQNDRS